MTSPELKSNYPYIVRVMQYIYTYTANKKVWIPSQWRSRFSAITIFVMLYIATYPT